MKTIFLSSVENMMKKIIEKKIINYAIFMDNSSRHKTEKMIKFHVDNKINVIFNTPFLSNFNSIEIAFRSLKNLLNKKIYESMVKMKNDIEKILKSVFSKDN